MNKRNKILKGIDMLEFFANHSNEFLLKSKLVKAYLDKYSADDYNESDEKTIRRISEQFDEDDFLNKLGFRLEKRTTKYRYSKIDQSNIIKKLGSKNCNALVDALSLASVSKNFHYRNDIPPLMKILEKKFELIDEKFEIYVGHNNNSGKGVILPNNYNLLIKIKEAIVLKRKFVFTIDFDEQNDNNSKCLLESKKIADDHGNYEFINHEMFPILIIHDSDETFIEFKKSHNKMIGNRYFVSLGNIRKDGYSISDDPQRHNHPIDTERAKFSIPSRKSIKMKVSTNVGYLLKTRQGDYEIIEENLKEEWMSIKFSEIYHGLNFIFMHNGPKNLFKEFYDDEINNEILFEWNKKITLVKDGAS